ncbi:MAG: hypothetical protein JWO96_746 [Candidatus Saccharibacteria bacterium]|nr:hypothetical protein [Candidatus Saccharibacteria bacterium]
MSKDDKARREAAELLEKYREGEEATAIAEELARLQDAYGAWRFRLHLDELDFTSIAVKKAKDAAWQAGREGALPHFYLALDATIDKQSVRAAFYRGTYLELVDERPEKAATQQSPAISRPPRGPDKDGLVDARIEEIGQRKPTRAGFVSF